MKINELIFPSDASKLRPGMHQFASLPIEKIVDLVSTMHQNGKDYKTIFNAVKQEFGADAKTYAVKNIASIIKGSAINEEFWAYPAKHEQIKQLKIVLSKEVTPAEAKKLLLKVLSSRQLFDVLDSMGKKDNATPTIVDYIKQQFPNLDRNLMGTERKDCINNCDGNLSPLGHEEVSDETR